MASIFSPVALGIVAGLFTADRPAGTGDHRVDFRRLAVGDLTLALLMRPFPVGWREQVTLLS